MLIYTFKICLIYYILKYIKTEKAYQNKKNYSILKTIENSSTSS